LLELSDQFLVFPWDDCFDLLVLSYLSTCSKSPTVRYRKPGVCQESVHIEKERRNSREKVIQILNCNFFVWKFLVLDLLELCTVHKWYNWVPIVTKFTQTNCGKPRETSGSLKYPHRLESGQICPFLSTTSDRDMSS
jgi:hypothetical protein